jgi:hypothetical protein
MQLFAVRPLRVILGLMVAITGSAVSGSSWSVQATPNPAGSTRTYLYGVACPSATSCTAIGTYLINSSYFPLAEQWDGQTWTIQPTPEPPSATTAELSAVACSSITDCTAVGFYWDGSAYHTLAEHWDGTAWAIEPTSDPPGAIVNILTGVACPSSTLCQATGYSGNGTAQPNTLAEEWNGTSWATEDTPNPAGATLSQLQGVSCASTTACTAVGQYNSSSGGTFTLAERWNGTVWAIQPTANPAGETYAQLESVACPSASKCTAIGLSSSQGSSASTLAERWDGKTWAIQPTPSPGPTGSGLHGVACPTTRTCIAVGGSSTSPSAETTLAERWNGKTWITQPTPNPADSTESELDGIACSSAKLCTAVGAFYDYTLTPSVADTLAERHS